MPRCPKCDELVEPHWRACPFCETSLLKGERDITAGPASPADAQTLSGCYESSWAVVIGINEYRYRDVPKLSYGVADAEAVADALTGVGFEPGRIITLTNDKASRQNIQDVLSVEMARKTGPNDRLLVFFAGHGQDYEAAFGPTRGYLIPFDGHPDRLASRCISMNEVDTWSELIPAKHVLFVMDCCYSGLAATRDSGLNPARVDYMAEITRRPVRQIITAGRADQKVLEESGQGVFTKAFVRGIKGEADTIGRGFVTGFDLGHYLETRVYEESRWQQQPLFRYLRGDGEFVFLPSVPSETSAGTSNFASAAAPVLAQPSSAIADDAFRRDIQWDIDECERSLLKKGQGIKTYLQEVFERRFPNWRTAADLGWPEGQWLLGRCHQDGLGVEKDAREAVRWYLKAAKQGFAAAQHTLAVCYAEGNGIKFDRSEAVRWHREAAEQGYAQAQLRLGGRYESGNGVAEDQMLAVYWYLEAAEQGHVEAQFRLAASYDRGQGVAQNKAEAVRWYRKAAAEGHSNAKRRLEELESRWCFLSTATDRALGQPDECDELTMFRQLRDTYMQQSPERRAEVEEYYEIAPLIVASIEACDEADTIWRQLADEYILPVVRLAESGDFPRAHQLYRQMVMTLRQRWMTEDESFDKPDSLNGNRGV